MADVRLPLDLNHNCHIRDNSILELSRSRVDVERRCPACAFIRGWQEAMAVLR